MIDGFGRVVNFLELDARQIEMGPSKHLKAETAAELDALLPAILDRAFKGQL